jgi:hypothetical protein
MALERGKETAMRTRNIYDMVSAGGMNVHYKFSQVTMREQGMNRAPKRGGPKALRGCPCNAWGGLVQCFSRRSRAPLENA